MKDQLKQITYHKVNGLNEALDISADERGNGNASHSYIIRLHPHATGYAVSRSAYTLNFQDGCIAEVGVNGISNEALIAIVIDRLQGFQSGPFKSRENALTLTKLEEAMHWSHARTRERQQRGVEGTQAL